MEYKIQFNQFLQKNELKVNDLPEPMQEKIDIFYRMHKLLDTIQETDLQDLLEQLEQLDIEILEDIEEQYVDLLTNNEPMEKVTNVKNKTGIVPQKKVVTSKDADERILDELFKMGMTKNIDRPKLRELGLKTKLTGDTKIGKYTLIRSSFFYFRYDIELAD